MDRHCGCGCEGSGCCAPKKPKPVIIDFLYLDLNVCSRCQGTEDVLREAISDVEKVLNAADLNVVVNKTLIDTKEKAIKHKMITSPTIRINGQDIDTSIKETQCESCGDLCGDDVDCRVWTYNGEEYTVPPKALIVNAILKAVYGEVQPIEQYPYTLPDNLKKFFKGKERVKDSIPIYQTISKLDEKHTEQLAKIMEQCWWAEGRTIEGIRTMVSNSEVIGVVDVNNNLIGFTRVLTDGVYKALILDVIVDKEYRGKKIGQLLLNTVTERFKHIRHLDLNCKGDMISFYEKWGFTADLPNCNLMRKTNG